MEIRDHKLVKASFQESPNRSGVFSSGQPDTIIIHYTAGSSGKSSIRTLCDPNSKASAHIVVDKDGTITQLVPFNTIAWHAGRSSYKGRIGFNKYSIGIEIDNAGLLTKTGVEFSSWFGRRYPEQDVVEAVHRNGSETAFWHRYEEEQITAVQALCEALVDTYLINAILGHEEIAPKRKQDPGPAFPLDRLRDRVLNRDRSEEGEETEITSRTRGFVTAGKLNIRSRPNSGSPMIAPPLRKGTMVNILQKKNGWYEVEVATRGWVSSDYVKT
jgi:N-acetylmuramoyl-L-alanine amidase